MSLVDDIGAFVEVSTACGGSRFGTEEFEGCIAGTLTPASSFNLVTGPLAEFRVPCMGVKWRPPLRLMPFQCAPALSHPRKYCSMLYHKILHVCRSSE